MEKYGLSRDDATRIATTDNEILTLDDLRYKYDDVCIGKDYPDWITPEEHLKMCYAVVWSRYNKGFFWYNSCDDVAHDLFVYSLLHINKYSNKFQLNGLLLCRLKNLIRDYARTFNSHIMMSDLEGEYEDDICSNKSPMSMCAYIRDDKDMAELVDTVLSIRNEKIKGILILCGYFVADIQEFLPLLVDYYNSSAQRVKDKVYDLGRDDEIFCSMISRTVDDRDKVNATVGRILRIFGYRDKNYIFTDLLPYMRSIGLAH